MAGSARDDDGESVLDLREQTNRPNDTAPILDPVWVIIGLFYFGIIMVPVGMQRIKRVQTSSRVIQHM
jgi:hypothetical protein